MAPSRGFVAWQALVDGYAPKASNDSAIALQPILATPKKCKDAKELKERLTAWSLKAAEYELQFKVFDEAQKIFVVREMMPKDIKREFLTGPRKFNGIMEKPRPSMKKMTKRHRWRASLKERTLKNSRAWRRLTKKESGAGLRRVESPGGKGGWFAGR